MNRNTVTQSTNNTTDSLSTEESEGYTQFLQTFSVQFKINMDQDHEDFKEMHKRRKKRMKIPVTKIPSAIIEE